jgi:hypothetical protein
MSNNTDEIKSKVRVEVLSIFNGLSNKQMNSYLKVLNYYVTNNGRVTNVCRTSLMSNCVELNEHLSKILYYLTELDSVIPNLYQAFQLLDKAISISYGDHITSDVVLGSLLVSNRDGIGNLFSTFKAHLQPKFPLIYQEHSELSQSAGFSISSSDDEALKSIHDRVFGLTEADKQAKSIARELTSTVRIGKNATEPSREIKQLITKGLVVPQEFSEQDTAMSELFLKACAKLQGQRRENEERLSKISKLSTSKDNQELSKKDYRQSVNDKVRNLAEILVEEQRRKSKQ